MLRGPADEADISRVHGIRWIKPASSAEFHSTPRPFESRAVKAVQRDERRETQWRIQTRLAGPKCQANEVVRTLYCATDFRPREELLCFHTILVMAKYNTLVYVDDEDRHMSGDAEPAKLKMRFRELIDRWARPDLEAPGSESPDGRRMTSSAESHATSLSGGAGS